MQEISNVTVRVNALQMEAIILFVAKKSDIFVNLKTGFNHYQAQLLIFDSMLAADGADCCCYVTARNSDERPGRHSASREI